jgi:hypothetical protein
MYKTIVTDMEAAMRAKLKAIADEKRRKEEDESKAKAE